MITGYTRDMAVSPGEQVEVCLFSDEGDVEARLVALGRGSDRGPVPLGDPVTVPATPQSTHVGSYLDAGTRTVPTGAVTLGSWVQPTAVTDREQVIVGLAGEDASLELRIDGRGRLVLARTDTVLIASGPVVVGAWLHVVASFDQTSGRTSMDLVTLGWDGHAIHRHQDEVVADPVDIRGEMAVSVGGSSVRSLRRTDTWLENRSLNGKISDPFVAGGELDFVSRDRVRTGAAPWLVVPSLVSAPDMGSTPRLNQVVDRIDDRVCHLHQVPTRAVTGPTWDGRSDSHLDDPAAYRAIHFHDDDLGDAQWRIDASLRVPDAARSGVYAVEVCGPQTSDLVPFYVLRAPGASARSEVAVVIPTMTYLAYSNSRLPFRESLKGTGFIGRDVAPGPRDYAVREHPEWGLSMYDTHSDGSGVSYSSGQRPSPTIRPDYTGPLPGGPRHLAADLLFLDFLADDDVDYEVLTDHSLDAQGSAALEGYRVLVLASHPEYVTWTILRGLQDFQAAGGRLMYLGGNGLYWVTTRLSDHPDAVEIRRGYAGTRGWESRPGEDRHASTGERGGLWRHRWLAPNSFVGVGMAAQGWDEQAGHYRRLDRGEARTAFLWSGIDGVDEFGRYGPVMNGAAGDEIDRHDPALGTPEHAVRVATSAGTHSAFIQLATEDVPATVPGLSGATNEKVRSDITLYETPAGGAVFSVGSISWIASMTHRRGDNEVATMTRNVLRRFVDPHPFTIPREVRLVR